MCDPELEHIIILLRNLSTLTGPSLSLSPTPGEGRWETCATTT